MKRSGESATAFAHLGQSRKLRLLRLRPYLLALATGTLASTVLLKLGDIQYLELLFVADLFIVLWLFMANRLRFTVLVPLFDIGRSYIIFVVLAFLLSLCALDQNFYSWNFTFFKRPVLLTIARIIELGVDVFYMLYLANLYSEDEGLCAFGAKAYYVTGVASGIYSILSFPLNYFFDLQLGTYGGQHRFRGFYNEGGPYGTYIITVCILGVAMRHRGWLSKTWFYASQLLLTFALLGAQSKSAFFAAAIVGFVQVMWSFRNWTRLACVLILGVVMAVLGSLLNIQEKIDAYVKNGAAYQELSHLRPNDGNFVQGKVSGIFLAPRMIEAHPLIGIGWGNYPLVRDDPAYRRGTPFSIANIDAPGLGPIDYIVDLGIPLWIYLTWIAIKPAYLLRRHRADPWLLSLALMQLLANWFGVHLNITYPWVVVGLALGMGFGRRQKLTTTSRAINGVRHPQIYSRER